MSSEPVVHRAVSNATTSYVFAMRSAPCSPSPASSCAERLQRVGQV
jgi:hypothetical protein